MRTITKIKVHYKLYREIDKDREGDKLIKDVVTINDDLFEELESAKGEIRNAIAKYLNITKGL